MTKIDLEKMTELFHDKLSIDDLSNRLFRIYLRASPERVVIVIDKKDVNTYVSTVYMKGEE